MFRGQFLHTLDPKGRLSIPAKFRDIIRERYGGRLILTGDIVNSCISVYTPEGWEEIEGKLNQAASMDETIKAFRRLFIAGAEDCYIDRQGRILISQRLREYASLTREALIAGVGNNKIEIWNPEKWEEVKASIDPATIARRMAELGI